MDVHFPIHKFSAFFHQALGNHEFDLGIDGLTPFLNNITFPALSCNIDSVNEPSFQGLYVCSYVLTLPGGDEIGFVGYTLESTPDYVQTGKSTRRGLK